MSFAQFSRTILGIEDVATRPNDLKTDLFYTSIRSSDVLMSWSRFARNPTDEVFDFELGFVEDLRPNAFADRWHSVYMIGQHSALFISILEFTLFCFAQSDFFPEVGASDKEVSPTPWDSRAPGIWLLDFTKHGGHVTDEHSRALIPRCSERYQIALDLAWLMARFVWLHEFSHCFNGHVDLAKERGLAPRLYELDLAPRRRVAVRRSARTIDDGATLKCLEFDADQSAFWASFNIQMKGMENIEDIRGLDLDLRLRLTFFASYASIWLIEQYQSYLDVADSREHPDPQLRLQNLFRTARDHILTRHPEVAPMHKAALRQFDVIAARIPTMYSTARLTELISDPALLAKLEAFDPRIQALKEELRAFEFSEHPK